MPNRLRVAEPLAALALAGHAAAVLGATGDRSAFLIGWVCAILVILGVAGLAGARTTTAVMIRCLAILVLGFVLQASRTDSAGYFLLWFFVVVSVYPLVLPHVASRLAAVAPPVAYLALVPLRGVDGPVGIAVLRAVSLALIGVFVHRAADAYRDSVRQSTYSETAAQAALATLQQALLPPEVTSQHGVVVAGRYQAAGIYDQIGGDWYDTIELPTGGMALVIGDVEGHDLTAASVMGLVRGAVRSYALEGHPPSIVLERVNTFLFSAAVDRLVTMVYVQLYPDDATATVAVAGHPLPLVVTADGHGVSYLAVPTGTLLGVDEHRHWDERTILLPRNASLVLYTDGLTGHRCTPEAQFAWLAKRTRLAAAGPAALLAHTLISGASGQDDAAVLVAQVRSVHAPPAQRTLPAQPISASIARVWVADLFDLWQAAGSIGTGPEVADRLDAAQLLLTELVSNAVRHSDRSVQVRLELVERRLRVEVADTSERVPVMRTSDSAATEGRGLRLVDALSSGWGVRFSDRGKVVWFEIVLDQRDEDFDEERLLAAFAEPDELTEPDDLSSSYH